MNRRHFSLALASALLAPLKAVADADTVFLDYSQDDLDKAYDQRNWAANAGEVIKRYSTDSIAARAKYPPRTERYGQSEAETLDIFAPAGARGLPVMVFVHGGAWRALSKDDSAAPVSSFVEHGCLYVALNFANIPAVRLPDMASQCRLAMLWIRANIARFGGDPQRIFVSGHSSGGHLAATLLATDWKSLGAPADLIKGGVVMSGMMELYPVLLSSRSGYVKVSAAEVEALSPMRHLDRIACLVIVVHGDQESPEFKRQANVFAEALSGMGRLRAQFVLRGKNHFEVPEAFNDASHPLTMNVLAMMKG
jgi:arylformamidase